MPPVDASDPTGHADELLESNWTDRGRRVAGRELRLELAVTAAFLVAAGLLVFLAPPGRAPHPAILALIVAYALSARAEFEVGSGQVVPTQLFLVALFALSPAALVPLFVFAGLSLSVVGAALFGGSRIDRLVYSGGDAAHALGPAVVVTLLAGGDAAQVGLTVLLLAFAAQLACDSASSVLHDRLVFGVRPTVHARVLVQVWGVDAMLTPIGILAGLAARAEPWAALLPLPLVALLIAMARDRSRRIDHAHQRLEALQAERARLQVAVRRIGDAFASNLDLDALLDIVTRAAVESLNGASGRASGCRAAPAPLDHRAVVDPSEASEAALAAAESQAFETRESVLVERAGFHALGCPVGAGDRPVAVLAIARREAITAGEQALVEYLCGQAAISAANVKHHELLRRQTLTDELTGLGNHRRLQEKLAEVCGLHNRDGTAAGLVLLDLDNFKLVNDQHGHQAGDMVLRAVGRRIAEVCRDDDEPARYGGEELAVLVPGVEGRDLCSFAERLRRSVAELELETPDGRRLTVTASVGVAMLGPGLREPAILIEAADRALYEAKRAGKNRIRLADSLASPHPLESTTSAELRRAIDLGQLVLHYQPKIAMRSGEVQGVEALVRWRHPDRGLLYPDAFVGAAETAGLIRPLTQKVFDLALAQCRAWRDDGFHLPVAVNISATSLTDTSLLRDVAASLERHDVPAEALTVELTESTLMTDPELADQVLRGLRRLGVLVSVDDYGTGYSSLAYLRRFTVDELKLDRAFVKELHRDPGTETIVRSTIELAHALNLRIVAEGVESHEAWSVLQHLDCDAAQGYHVTGPLEAGELIEWLRERHPIFQVSAP